MANKLASETSPYLLQHAENPVAWYPWTEEALTAARERQQPILLSIGYSACHWCHVMAHESFEDPAIAAVMNEHFVNIKVDREERPDLDKIYQLSHQLLTQQGGGWPLTMFLDPDTLVPFFGGTYFPRSPRMQLPGFADLLLRINEFWQDKRDALKEQGQRISEVLDALNASPAADLDAVPAEQLMDQAVEQLRTQYDSLEGGFGDSPKFPMPGTLDLILRYRAQRREAGKDIADMVMITLTKIARGGIHDHLGGGFFRYATDRKWMIPHFEKMLYDNGQLLSLYCDALALGPDPLFTEAARGTATWLLRDMRHPLGGFYAALDADSEGEEGRYYLWRRDDIKRHLSETEYLLVETLYGIDKPANFEGKWNLHRYDAWRSVVQRLSLEPGAAIETLESAKAKLLAIRQNRTPPALDDKILTAWNALAIKGLAKASIQLDEPAWLAAARDCADFLRNNLWTGALLHATWKGAPKYAGYLDDYANLLDAIVTLLACGWRDEDAEFALALADTALRDFEDPVNGGFFFTADDRDLIHRPKPTMDDALPPGNAVMIQVLMKLGHLFGETRYIDAAERAVSWARSRVQQLPSGHCQLLAGLELASRPAEQIIIRGPAAEAEAWLLATRTGYTPWRQVYAISYDSNSVLPRYLPALVSAEQRQRTVAYRCEGLSCSAPIDSIAELRRVLGEI